MTNKLTPLEALESIKHTTDLYRPNELNGYKAEIDIIETALKEHQNDKQIWENYLKEIKNLPPIEVQLKLKALEIIKEKEVAVDEFIRCCKNEENSLEEYNNFAGDENSLTQEEFDLLKEQFL